MNNKLLCNFKSIDYIILINLYGSEPYKNLLLSNFNQSIVAWWKIFS
jgi:hypothetical protein